MIEPNDLLKIDRIEPGEELHHVERDAQPHPQCVNPGCGKGLLSCDLHRCPGKKAKR